MCEPGCSLFGGRRVCIEQLYAEHKKSVSPSVHTRVYAGILEAMYGGVGGEVLYSPYKQRWALGLNVNAVKQREFERNFKFRDYETVTAHVSAYYASPFYNVDMWRAHWPISGGR